MCRVTKIPVWSGNGASGLLVRPPAPKGLHPPASARPPDVVALYFQMERHALIPVVRLTWMTVLHLQAPSEIKPKLKIATLNFALRGTGRNGQPVHCRVEEVHERVTLSTVIPEPNLTVPDFQQLSRSRVEHTTVPAGCLLMDSELVVSLVELELSRALLQVVIAQILITVTDCIWIVMMPDKILLYNRVLKMPVRIGTGLIGRLARQRVEKEHEREMPSAETVLML